ncbi:MAG TPA: GyrI-like domain-containing protein [Acidobacteriaceae bacterium]|nr:GyrI-like domain-containing protein [Acidobacteriaceae bacterium]
MAATIAKEIQLTLQPDTIRRPEMHYVFIEKVGSIPANAPQAWNAMHAWVPAIAANNQVTGYMSLYCMERGIYRAGIAVAAEPQLLPAGVQYEKIAGGQYSRFVLTGSYSQLPEATGLAVARARELELPLRADYNIENYVSDPRVTPEDQNIIEILFPVN